MGDISGSVSGARLLRLTMVRMHLLRMAWLRVACLRMRLLEMARLRMARLRISSLTMAVLGMSLRGLEEGVTVAGRAEVGRVASIPGINRMAVLWWVGVAVACHHGWVITCVEDITGRRTRTAGRRTSMTGAAGT